MYSSDRRIKRYIARKRERLGGGGGRQWPVTLQGFSLTNIMRLQCTLDVRPSDEVK